MQLENLPSRLDPESVACHFPKIGWPMVEVGEFYEVNPSPETPALLISHYVYDFCGTPIRPVFAKFSVQTYLDPAAVGTVMMRAAFGYLGALALFDMDADEKKITFSYRVLIPGMIDDAPQLLSACFAAACGAADLQSDLRRLHE